MKSNQLISYCDKYANNLSYSKNCKTHVTPTLIYFKNIYHQLSIELDSIIIDNLHIIVHCLSYNASLFSLQCWQLIEIVLTKFINTQTWNMYSITHDKAWD